MTRNRSTSAFRALRLAVSGAAPQAGIDAVIADGWGRLRGVHNDFDVLVIESAPHHWLFPMLRPSSITKERDDRAGLLAAHPSSAASMAANRSRWRTSSSANRNRPHILTAEPTRSSGGAGLR